MKNRMPKRHPRNNIKKARKRFRLDGRRNVSRPDVPKAQRERVTVGPVPPLVDSMRTLGHPPRGRR